MQVHYKYTADESQVHCRWIISTLKEHYKYIAIGVSVYKYTPSALQVFYIWITSVPRVDYIAGGLQVYCMCMCAAV